MKILTLANLAEPWFTHSAGEGLQYVRVLKGTLDIPAPLRPYQEIPFEAGGSPARPEAVQNIDLVLTEISILRSSTVGGFYAHLPRIWKAAEKAGLSPRDATDKAGVTWPNGHALAGLTVRYDEEQDLLSSLRAISDEVRAPIATSDHLSVLDQAGKPLPGRERISTLLSAMTKINRIPFYSTRPMLTKHGETTALLDSSHYNVDFEKVAATYLWAFLSPLL